MSQTIRAARPDTTICLTCDLGQVSFPEDATCPLDMDDTHLLVRRSGGCEDDWLVAYRPFARTTDGNIQFRLDGAIHELPKGYYDGVIMEGCDPCGLIRFDKTKKPALNMTRIAALAFTECPPPGGALPGDGHNDMLDNFLNWKSTLDCALTTTATAIKLTDSIPTPIPDGGVEVVLRDGIAVETVTITDATDGNATVTRGNPALAFPKGACVQFEWTIANIKTVANEDCPELPDDTGDDTTGTDDDTTKSAVLEVGKGLVLNTDEEGRIVLSLAETGVPAGDYGGIQVDECGRVVVVDAEFPANSMPVIDGCCKED